MKQLLISALLLFVCHGCGEKMCAQDEPAKSVTSSSYVDAADALTFTPSEVADFILIAQASIEVSNDDTFYSVRLNHDTGTSPGKVWEYVEDQPQDQDGEVVFLHKKSLGAISQTFSIEVKRTAGTGQVEVKNVSIFAVRK